MNRYLLLLVLLALSACTATKTPYYDTETEDWSELSLPDKPVVHSLYMLGDAGATAADSTRPVLAALEQMLSVESEESSMVFLGDQIYDDGMPGKKDEGRTNAETVLGQQLEILRDYQGRAYFIAGEKDWNNAKAKGRKALLRQEKFIESYFSEKKKARMVPGNGCGDPKVVKIHKDLAYIFLDSQWWLQDWEGEKHINQGCHIKSRHDLLDSVKEALTEHKNDEVVFFMHHPIMSNGIHGGHASLKDHIFPYRESHGLSIPLPVFGTAVQLYRKITGGKQDLANAQYKELTQGITAIAEELRMRVVFASAHDNGLQHFAANRLQFIISGSGAKTNHTSKDKYVSFANQALGFTKILFYEEFETWMEMYSVKPGEEARLIYRYQLRAPRPGTVEEEITYLPIAKQDTLVAANESFMTSKALQFITGSQYREMWATPVQVPFIDLEKQFGGLTPVKKGGGMASNSLRMQREDGKQFILRSINKDYRKLVPPGMGDLKLLNIMKDQNSASHPYAALVIPELSKSAGIYYTAPKLVYLKHQRGLGNYNSQFPEEVYLLEERPSGDWSDAEQFGFSPNIIGYSDLLVNLREKKNHHVDQQWVLKSRIFDLLIHDWDRHDDQWRWASFKEGDKTIYRPIPRDRDQAFYKFKGVLPWYVAAFIVKKFRTIKHDLKNPAQHSFNARYFDRYFLHDLEWSEWVQAVEQMQKDMTDEALTDAWDMLPPEVRGEDDAELISMLKSRRDNLLTICRKQYEFLSQEVQISGTDHKDRFEVERFEDGSVNVTWYAERKDKGDIKHYDRTFLPKETREIRLYGLRGKDEVKVSGADNSAIRIRFIGGADKDEFKNKTGGKRLFAYDEPDGIKLKGEGIKDKTSLDVHVNDYERNGFLYNTNFYAPTFGSTVDDGFWLGGMLNWTTNAWRKLPYKASQSANFSVAPFSRNAVRIGYTGLFPEVIGPLGLSLSSNVDFPWYTNYYGPANEASPIESDIRYNWVRLQSFDFRPQLFYSTNDQATTFTFGPSLVTNDIEVDEGRISTSESFGFQGQDLDRRWYVGADFAVSSGFVDRLNAPANGLLWNAGIEYLRELNLDEEVLKWNADMSFYITLVNRPELVLANKFGYAQIFGDPQFFQYPDLGNTTNLRGYRLNRFRGDRLFFHNVDLRARLFTWDNTWLPMDIGLLAGIDSGRVWLDEIDGNEDWHHSQTIGVWFDLLGFLVVQPHYSFTEEQDAFSLRVGFNF